MGDLSPETILELLEVDPEEYDKLCAKHPELPLRDGPVQLELDFEPKTLPNEVLRKVFGRGINMDSKEVTRKIAERLGIAYDPQCSVCQGEGKWMGLQTWHQCETCNGTGQGS